MKNKALKQIVFSLVTIILLLALTISLTYSWLLRNKQAIFTYQTGDYEASINVMFNNIPVDETSPFYDATKQVIVLDGENPLSTNYINRMKVVVTITAENAARFRIKIQDEWVLTRTYYESSYVITEAVTFHDEELIPGNPKFPYFVTNVTNYIFDAETGYLYFNGILEKNQTYVIEFIVGGTPYLTQNTDAYFEDCIVHLDFLLDIVQANRFSPVWGIPLDFFG
jgi:hypothetical protein